MSKLKKLSLLLLLTLPLAAQVPNCQINFGPWTDTNQTPASFNGVTQCAYWVITYQVTGFSAISLAFESATGTQAGPGSFSNFTGTVATGSNPNTSVSCATPTNCTTTFTGTPGWYRVHFPTHTGSGTIQGTLQGYKTGYFLGGNTPTTGSGCPGTVGTPCVVVGPVASGMAVGPAPELIAGSDGTDVRTVRTAVDGSVVVFQNTPGNLQATANGTVASGVPVSGNPVRVGGSDGANTQDIKTDTNGRLEVVGPAAAGAAVAGNPLLQGLSDGVNIQNAFYCPNQAAVTLSGATDIVIVAGVSAKKTYICHLDFAATAAGTFTIQEGTGSTCGTSTAAITGAYPTITTFTMDYSSKAALHSTTAANDICLHAGSSATVGGFVTYAQF